MKIPKINKFIIITVIGTILLLYLGIAIFSVKNQQEIVTVPSLPKESVNLQKKDEELTEIGKEVLEFNSKLDKLDNFQKKLSRPIVNLEIVYK